MYKYRSCAQDRQDGCSCRGSSLLPEERDANSESFRERASVPTVSGKRSAYPTIERLAFAAAENFLEIGSKPRGGLSRQFLRERGVQQLLPERSRRRGHSVRSSPIFGPSLTKCFTARACQNALRPTREGSPRDESVQLADFRSQQRQIRARNRPRRRLTLLSAVLTTAARQPAMKLGKCSRREC